MKDRLKIRLQEIAISFVIGAGIGAAGWVLAQAVFSFLIWENAYTAPYAMKSLRIAVATGILAGLLRAALVIRSGKI